MKKNQLEDAEKSAIRRQERREKKKRPKMGVSGKSVFQIKKIIEKK